MRRTRKQYLYPRKSHLKSNFAQAERNFTIKLEAFKCAFLLLFHQTLSAVSDVDIGL